MRRSRTASPRRSRRCRASRTASSCRRESAPRSCPSASAPSCCHPGPRRRRLRRTTSLPRATSPSRAGCGRAEPDCAGARGTVEPRSRYGLAAGGRAPTRGGLADVDALLLDPGVVPEVEDARAVGMAELEHMVVDNAFQVTAEQLASVDLVEPARIAAPRLCMPLARIQRGAVGGDVHDDVVGAIIQMLRELDGPDNAGEPRDTDIVERPPGRGAKLAPPGEIPPSDFAAEQLIEAVARRVRYGDDGIGVHDVVDQRNVLVADALDVVRAVPVAQQGGAFERFDG